MIFAVTRDEQRTNDTRPETKKPTIEEKYQSARELQVVSVKPNQAPITRVAVRGALYNPQSASVYT
jgi:hypothetical protein